MTKKLNIEAVKLYIAGEGQHCLFCGESSPEGASFDVSDGAARQEMFCSACDADWTDSYRLAAVIHGGEVFEPNEEIDTLKVEIERLKRANHDAMHALFRHFTSRNFVDVGDMMGEMARHLGLKPPKAADNLKVANETKRLNEVAILEGLWKELRTKDHFTAPEVMGHLSIIIGEKRGDPDKSFCGCGGETRFTTDHLVTKP